MREKRKEVVKVCVLKKVEGDCGTKSKLILNNNIKEPKSYGEGKKITTTLLHVKT